MTKLIATSVIRGSEQGESHGGNYQIDSATNSVVKAVDWNNCDIDFQGRGADRGLRGIAFYKGNTYIAASNEIFIFNQHFEILSSLSNPYLSHCHEICIEQDMLYITSTGFDAIVMYDLVASYFSHAIHIKPHGAGFKMLAFNPLTTKGPKLSNKLHLNSVSSDKNSIYFSGRKAPYLFQLTGTKFGAIATIPLGTHNAQCAYGGVIFNDTNDDRVCLVTDTLDYRVTVPQYERQSIVNIEQYLSEVARPGFGRGLALLPDQVIAAGSSPSTIAFHDLNLGCITHQINISMDVRNAIHGLELWPY